MKHLSYTDRLKIEWCFSHGITRKSAIAKELQCSLSTVYYELQRDCWYWRKDTYEAEHKFYSADKAQQDYDWKNSIRGHHDKLSNNWTFVHYIETQIIDNKASPAVALFRWSELGNSFSVSVKTLYRYIDSGLYFPHLTNRHLPEKLLRHKSYHKVVRPKRAPKGRSIEKRPLSVFDRSTFGHWEMDSVIGKAQGRHESLLVLTERLSRFQIIVRAAGKDSASTVDALWRLSRLCDFPRLFKSITVDNGSEFQNCIGMESFGTTLYYCHPYTSCERGSNERNNRIIRRFFPKGKSLAKITDHDCKAVARWMNDLPRKVLQMQTARSLFDLYTSTENITQNISDFY
jgi:IS30 family transposase